MQLLRQRRAVLCNIHKLLTIKRLKNVEIIVFDLYNTLIKIKEKGSESYFRAIFNQIKNELNLSPSIFFEQVLTTNLDDLIKRWPRSFEHAIRDNKHLLQQEIKSVEKFEETQEVLLNLSKMYPLFLISNLATPYKQGYYDSDIDQYFEKAIFSCDVGLKKPNKDIFKIIENETGKSNDQILMIGDSTQADIEGPRRLNWNTILINRSRNRYDKHFHQISSLNEIRQIL